MDYTLYHYYDAYMTLGECPWLLNWFDEGQELSISLNEFEPQAVSFTYGDLFPAMRYQDGKPYRGQLYTIHEIVDVIQEFGLPQQWNAAGEKGPERYIEAQVWDEGPLLRRLGQL